MRSALIAFTTNRDRFSIWIETFGYDFPEVTQVRDTSEKKRNREKPTVLIHNRSPTDTEPRDQSDDKTAWITTRLWQCIISISRADVDNAVCENELRKSPRNFHSGVDGVLLGRPCRRMKHLDGRDSIAGFVSRLMARINVLNLNVSVKDGRMVNVRFRSWNIVSFEFETMRASFELL